MSLSSRRIEGVLLIHHRPMRLTLASDASNVTENINAFARHSQHPVWTVNCALGMPPSLRGLKFDAVMIHYSVFVARPVDYFLDEDFLEYLADADGYKIATFQDEHHWCGKRFQFIDEFGIDCVFTMLEQERGEEVYLGRTNVSRVVSNLPGYVGNEVLKQGRRYSVPNNRRTIDVGYRGRPIATYMGAGAQEKSEVGERFVELAADSGLVVDIDVTEHGRLYGAAWPKFLASCRTTLGVESGVSCFDLEDEVRLDWERLSEELGREPTIEELRRSGPLARWDWKIPYRTISPRHFEAAALRVCQVLFEGSYSGVMEPGRHYIPLRKDFENMDDVLRQIRSPEIRAELTENAHRDLIESGKHSYETFVAEVFDPVLADAGLGSGQVGRLEVRRIGRQVRHTHLGKIRLYLPRLWIWIYLEHRTTWWILNTLYRSPGWVSRAIRQLWDRLTPGRGQ